VWIAYFKNRDAALTAMLDSFLLQDRVCINGVILAELIQGIRNSAEKKELADLMSALHALEIPMADWRLAGEISSELRQKGITLPLTDIGIAANAIRNKVKVLTYDAHYSHFEHLDVILLKLA
jgi:predicted nucleic acid-binding protein